MAEKNGYSLPRPSLLLPEKQKPVRNILKVQALFSHHGMSFLPCINHYIIKMPKGAKKVNLQKKKLRERERRTNRQIVNKTNWKSDIRSIADIAPPRRLIKSTEIILKPEIRPSIRYILYLLHSYCLYFRITTIV